MIVVGKKLGITASPWEPSEAIKQMQETQSECSPPLPLPHPSRDLPLS